SHGFRLAAGFFFSCGIAALHHLTQKLLSPCSGFIGRPGRSVTTNCVPTLPTAIDGPVLENVSDCCPCLPTCSKAGDCRIPDHLTGFQCAHFAQPDASLL